MCIMIDVMIVLFTLLSIGIYFMGVADGLGAVYAECLKYFTADSNILVAIASAITIGYSIAKIKNKDFKVPTWVTVLKMVATVCVTLTFLTTVFFLGPTFSIKTGNVKTYFELFADNIYFLHFATPALAIIAFIFYDPGESLGKRAVWFGLVPVVIYGVVYFFCVMIFKIWKDFYGFSFGGRFEVIPFVVLAMAAAVLLISFLEWKGREAVLKRLKQAENL